MRHAVSSRLLRAAAHPRHIPKHPAPSRPLPPLPLTVNAASSAASRSGTSVAGPLPAWRRRRRCSRARAAPRWPGRSARRGWARRERGLREGEQRARGQPLQPLRWSSSTMRRLALGPPDRRILTCVVLGQGGQGLRPDLAHGHAHHLLACRAAGERGRDVVGGQSQACLCRAGRCSARPHLSHAADLPATHPGRRTRPRARPAPQR